MLAMQGTKSKSGKKLKTKLVNVTCQTEETTTYLEHNRNSRSCPKSDNHFNSKRILKIIRKYLDQERNNNVKKCSLIRYIKRKQKYINVSKTKSVNSVIYMGTKKLKNKRALRNLSRKSVIYIGTTYNTLETTRNNDIVDLTQVEPALKLIHKSNTTQKSTEQPLLFQNYFPKTTTKYYKRPLFNSISDSVLFVKSKEFYDLQYSNYSAHMHKKFKPELIPNDRNMCLRELMNIKLPQLSTIIENDASRDSADISAENTDSDYLKINCEVPEIISDTTENINVIEDVLDKKAINGVIESVQDTYTVDNQDVVNEFEIMDNPAFDTTKNIIDEVLNNANKMEEHVVDVAHNPDLLPQISSLENGSTDYLVENVLPREQDEKLLEEHDEVTENKEKLLERDENI